MEQVSKRERNRKGSRRGKVYVWPCAPVVYGFVMAVVSTLSEMGNFWRVLGVFLLLVFSKV